MLKRFFTAKSFRLHISMQKKKPGNIVFDISKVRKSSRRDLLGRHNCILSQESVPQGPFWWIKSADLRFGVLDHVVGKTRVEGYLPPSPLRPGGRCLLGIAAEGLVEGGVCSRWGSRGEGGWWVGIPEAR